jgi:hypothetical protein
LSSISLSGLLASWCRFLGHLQWLCAAFNNTLTQSNAQLLNTEYCTDNTRYREHCPAARQCNAGYPGRAKQIHAANAIRKAWGLQLGISTSVQRPLRAVRPKINFSFDRWPLLQVLRKVSKPEHCGVKLANGSNFLELTRTTFYHNLSQPSVRLSTYKVSTLSQHSLKTTAKLWGEIVRRRYLRGRGTASRAGPLPQSSRFGSLSGLRTAVKLFRSPRTGSEPCGKQYGSVWLPDTSPLHEVVLVGKKLERPALRWGCRIYPVAMHFKS